MGHRVLHGGSAFTQSCIIDDECIAAIEKCIPLGPLHNPANLMGIRACQELMPDKKQVAVFDTAFHMTMPPEAYIYALPYEYYEKDDVRRYGFHGTSHRYVSSRALKMLGRENNPEGTKIITCHLAMAPPWPLSRTASALTRPWALGLLPACQWAHAAAISTAP